MIFPKFIIPILSTLEATLKYLKREVAFQGMTPQ